MKREDINWGKELQQEGRLIKSVPILQKMPVVEVGEILEGLSIESLANLLPMFTPDQQGRIFAEFDTRKQLSFFQGTSKKFFSVIFENMPSEARVNFYRHLTQQEQAALIPYLSKATFENVLDLSAYPPETAGGIMDSDYASVDALMTCGEAMEKVRRDAPSKRTVYYIYVIDEDKQMIGFITLKDLIMAEPNELVKSVLHTDFVFAFVDEDREEVANKIEKYDLVAIPVTNRKGQLLGIVTHDEAMDIIREEHTEDMEKFMGIVPTSEDLGYLQTSSWQHFKKRVTWIISLAAVGIISGLIIHRFEGTLEKLLVLALYMPMVADTGGNSGSQAATVVVRALALGQVKVKSWFQVIWKEARISLLLAICLGVLAYGKVLFLSWETEIPAGYSLTSIAFMISLALSMQVVTATVIGAGLPLLVKKIGGDPAVAASPAITTIVDITGLLIYFGMATLFFLL